MKRFILAGLILAFARPVRDAGAATVSAGTPAGYPFFSAVQVLTDPRTTAVDPAFLTRFDLNDPSIPAVFEPPAPALLRAAERGILPAAAAHFDQQGLEPWFEFAPIREAQGLELPAAFDVTYHGGRFNQRTLEHFGRLVQTAHENVDGSDIVPVVVANIYMHRVSRKPTPFPLPMEGYAITRRLIARIVRETGMIVPDRPMVLIHNNSWMDEGFFEEPPSEAGLVVAHELGHLTGLIHTRDEGNLMNVASSGGLLDARQAASLRRWLGYHGRAQEAEPPALPALKTYSAPTAAPGIADPAEAAPAGKIRRGSFEHKVFMLAYEMASRGKGEVRFGAVLVDRNGRIIGKGRNRLSEKSQRERFNHTDWKARARVAAGIQAPHRMLEGNLDYAIHAEQDAIADAIGNKKGLKGATIYALGVRKDGLVGRRALPTWTCRRCAVWIEYFGLKGAMELTRRGWTALGAAELYPAADQNSIRGKAFWKKQQKEVHVEGVQNYEWVPLEDLLAE